jgi:hypothetical protein
MGVLYKLYAICLQLDLFFTSELPGEPPLAFKRTG